MTRSSLPVSAITSGKSPLQAVGGTKSFWFEGDGFVHDVDCFVKTIATIKANGARPDHIGSVIAHYASTRLPDLSGVVMENQQQYSHSVTACVMKKRFLVETLIGILPPEKDSVSCNFLLRLLRTANIVGADTDYKADLEVRISWQLEEASLTELMIPSFSHTCAALLDVELVTRVVKNFARIYNEGIKSGTSLIKVAKLVDSYLAEAAADLNLSLIEFITLTDALPRHSRVTEDGLYLALDTYLKAHPDVTKQERRRLCGLIGIKKLSMEASLHAAENPRLPVRTIIQILFTEQTKLSHGRHNNSIDCNVSSLKPTPSWCMSKFDMNVQQAEISRLRVGIGKLHNECEAMRRQVKKEKKGGRSSTGNTCGSKWYFRWKMLRFSKCFTTNDVEKKNGGEFGDNKEGEEEFELEDLTTVLGDAIASSGQVDNREDPTALIIPDQQIKRNREGKRLKKEMNQLMEQLVEGDRKINTTSSSAQKIVDEATHHRDQNLPNPDKFGLLTKTTRINNHIHVPADSDLCTLKYGGSNQPINARYCCSTPPLFKEV
ncbi:hypothetical protein IGI04_029408 [Brassica rapa subsp. trilocularis]|uniref:NPH3 domain-containing protein n=1 Tax=Brassica rapa subsp. trilocularis TaxID=1813537 RepID=A0ABQ7LNQ8_BRACM|nr:hypothetical protein IGI04_029408 [Brassica rapa subsp. trilocularis]